MFVHMPSNIILCLTLQETLIFQVFELGGGGITSSVQWSPNFFLSVQSIPHKRVFIYIPLPLLVDPQHWEVMWEDGRN